MLEKENNEPSGKYRLPKTGEWVNYDTYRKLRGKCETCKAQMDTHPKCDACGALCGKGHLEKLPSPYQEQKLCKHCIGFWKGLDKVIGRKATWSEFQNPDKIKKIKEV